MRALWWADFKTNWLSLKGGARRQARRQAMHSAVQQQARTGLRQGTLQVPLQRGERLDLAPRNYVDAAAIQNPTWNRRVNQAAAQQAQRTAKALDSRIAAQPVSKATVQQKASLRRVVGLLSPADKQRLIADNKRRVTWHRRLMLSGDNGIGKRVAHDHSHVVSHPHRSVGVSERNEDYATSFETMMMRRKARMSNTKDTRLYRDLLGLKPDEHRMIYNQARIRAADPAYRAHDVQVNIANARRGRNVPPNSTLRYSVPFSAPIRYRAEFSSPSRNLWRKAALRRALRTEAQQRLKTGTIQLPLQRGEVLPHNPRYYVDADSVANPVWNARVNKQASRIAKSTQPTLDYAPLRPTKATPQVKQELRTAMSGLSPEQRRELVAHNKRVGAWHRRLSLSDDSGIGKRFAHDHSHHFASRGRPLGVSYGDEDRALILERAIDRQYSPYKMPLDSERSIHSKRTINRKRFNQTYARGVQLSRDPVYLAHEAQVRAANARQGHSLGLRSDSTRRSVRFSMRSLLWADFKKLGIPRATPYSPDEWARRTSSEFIGGLKGRERRVWRKAAMRDAVERRVDNLMFEREHYPQNVRRLPLQRAEQRNSMIVPSEWRHTISPNPRPIKGRFNQLPRRSYDLGNGVTRYLGAGRRNLVENQRLNPTWERKVDKSYSQRLNQTLGDVDAIDIPRNREPGGSTLLNPTGKATPNQKRLLRSAMSELSPSERKDLINLNQSRVAFHRRMKMTQVPDKSDPKFGNLYNRIGHDNTHVLAAQRNRAGVPREPALNTSMGSEQAALLFESLADGKPPMSVKTNGRNPTVDATIDRIYDGIQRSGIRNNKAYIVHDNLMRLAAERQGIKNPWDHRRAARYSAGLRYLAEFATSR